MSTDTIVLEKTAAYQTVRKNMYWQGILRNPTEKDVYPVLTGQYDIFGFDEFGIHRLTGTDLDPNRFDVYGIFHDPVGRNWMFDHVNRDFRRIDCTLDHDAKEEYRLKKKAVKNAWDTPLKFEVPTPKQESVNPRLKVPIECTAAYKIVREKMIHRVHNPIPSKSKVYPTNDGTYDCFGFDRQGIHKDTKTRHDRYGFNVYGVIPDRDAKYAHLDKYFCTIDGTYDEVANDRWDEDCYRQEREDEEYDRMMEDARNRSRS